jgi:hypothetical protein
LAHRALQAAPDESAASSAAARRMTGPKPGGPQWRGCAIVMRNIATATRLIRPE